MLMLPSFVNKDRDGRNGGRIETLGRRSRESGVECECTEMLEASRTKNMRDRDGAAPPVTGVSQEPLGIDVEHQDQENYQQ